MDLPLSAADYLRYESSVWLLKEVVAQINKDFRLQGFDVEFSGKGETAYQKLSRQLKPVIDHMLENQTEKFWNLLYGIDLNERKVKNILFSENQNLDTIQALTDLILKRELQKVVIRLHYSGKQLP